MILMYTRICIPAIPQPPLMLMLNVGLSLPSILSYFHSCIICIICFHGHHADSEDFSTNSNVKSSSSMRSSSAMRSVKRRDVSLKTDEPNAALCYAVKSNMPPCFLHHNAPKSNIMIMPRIPFVPPIFIVIPPFVCRLPVGVVLLGDPPTAVWSAWPAGTTVI